ncbi:hypothetical protein AX15_006955 [Amanita polypyramis BW_CC]|nr:hypothetical protein AX15_006955 [Amanita polypyramis BW_CC]
MIQVLGVFTERALPKLGYSMLGRGVDESTLLALETGARRKRTKNCVFESTQRPASALASGSWVYDLFHWTASNEKVNYATRDAVLSVCPPPDTANVYPSLLEDLKKIKSPEQLQLMTFEFMNLSHATQNAMSSIMHLTKLKEFPWVDCQAPDCCASDNPTPTVTTNEADTERAIWLIQRVWAEAVKRNVTFVVINAWNYEIIGYRSREDQALYLNEIIDIGKQTRRPGYLRLHTGLYIAALRDALGRAAGPTKKEKTVEVSHDMEINKEVVEICPSPLLHIRNSNNPTEMEEAKLALSNLSRDPYNSEAELTGIEYTFRRERHCTDTGSFIRMVRPRSVLP